MGGFVILRSGSIKDNPEMKRAIPIRPNFLCAALFGYLLCQTQAIFAQVPGERTHTKSDQEFLKQVRSLYYARGSRPAYVACDATLDWDAFVKQFDLPETDARRQGLELARAMKVSFVTRDSSRTEVSVEADPALAKQKQMLDQQITGFFKAYWQLSYGHMFPQAKDTYALTSSPDGYVMTISAENDLTGELYIDRSFRITKLITRGHPIVVEVTPKFERENDGLFHLSGMLYERKVGESRTLWEYSFDVQQVGDFLVPQHVTMSMPGALSYKHTFDNCKALSKANAPTSTPLDLP
jgi:hypothetical protein